MPLDTSPDSKCPICLDRLDNTVYLDPCRHKFCFSCIQEWSKIKAECPFCQQPFFSLCYIVHAEDDISRPEENESFSYSDSSIITSAERTFDLKVWDQHTSSDYPTPLHNEGSSSDSTTLVDFPDEVDSQVLEHGSSKHSVDWLSWNDETPGPSEEYNAITTSPEVLESSDEDFVWERTTLHPQLQIGVDSSDSDSSEYHNTTGYVNLYADRTPELTELSSDSEDSVRERKKEDMKKEQSIQDVSWSDREPSTTSLPFSPLYKKHVSSHKSSLLSVVKRIVSMDEQENKDHSPHDSDWSLSPGMENACSSHSQRLSGKRKISSPQNSETTHGHQPWRKHLLVKYQFKKRLSKSRDGSKSWSKRSRISRPHDTSPSLKSQTESTSCESTSSRDSSRSWSHHKGHGQRKSSSLDSDCCYRRAGYQSSYLLHSPKTAGDSFSCSKSTQTKAHCSNMSPGLESRIQSFTGRTDLQSQTGFQERQDSCYKQHRSGSRSSSRSRSPSGEADKTRSIKPGGKRKCKTRHLENTEKGSTTMERKYSLPAFSDCYKNKGSLSDNQESSEIKHEEKNKSMGNPSVEGVYKGTEIMKCALKRKCKKKHQEHHWKDA
ncbi:E3 ubiquitin-protein ligase Topors-like [Tympanuchus pallidicinctus]|uniref:E3 ubiquitin-protein ligase Topors-like n=1 Tax=Tympanuchus pallidicinctus TaxID=109042 RepID=UPI002286E2B7|nr:E3 ubiquitin-protein ligase Topors-like [Tympanuchus pallidicinctus]